MLSILSCLLFNAQRNAAWLLAKLEKFSFSFRGMNLWSEEKSETAVNRHSSPNDDANNNKIRVWASLTLHKQASKQSRRANMQKVFYFSILPRFLVATRSYSASDRSWLLLCFHKFCERTVKLYLSLALACLLACAEENTLPA